MTWHPWRFLELQMVKLNSFTLLCRFFILLSSLVDCKKIVGNTVLGVDLGGYFMKAAYVAPGEEDPFPILLSDLSERKSAHVVAFRKGKALFGGHATKVSITNPESTFSYFYSHLLGRQFDDPSVAYYQSKFSPPISSADDRQTAAVADEKGNKVPIEFIESLYLDNLKEQLLAVSHRALSGTVFAVPAYFNQQQRQALLDAADIANVKVFAMINAPSAAAVYYGTQVFNSPTPQNVIIFDSGSTGTSAVVAHIDPAYKQGKTTMTSIEIKAIASDVRLSGHAVDMKMVEFLSSKFSADNKGAQVPIGKPFNRLLNEAVRLKHILSANKETYASLEDVLEDQHLNCKISREDLNLACHELTEIAGFVIGNALASANLTMDDIATVIPVGGNSRVPFILQALKETVGEAKLSQALNAEEAAVKGATLYAATLSTFRFKPFRFKDVISSGLDMSYSSPELPADESRTIHVYPVSISQLESHKGISLRNIDKADILLSEQPGDKALFKVHIEGVQAAVSKFENVEDSKLKVWLDIDRNGLFKVESPVALIEYQKLVAPPAETSSKAASTSETSATATDTTTTSSVAAPKEPVLTKFTESVPLTFKVEPLVKKMSEESKALFRKRIADDRAALEKALQRSEARNNLEAMVYKIRGDFDSESFSKWFKADELKHLKEETDLSYKIVEEDKPEISLDQFRDHVEKLKNIQASPNLRKSEYELRTTAIPEFEKAIKEIVAYADNTLKMHEPANRAQTDEELNKLLADGQTLEKELEEKLKKQNSLPFNEDPVFLCSEFTMRIELLKINMKMMKRKVLPPKTTSTVASEAPPTDQATRADSPTATTEGAGAGATTQAEVPEEHFDL